MSMNARKLQIVHTISYPVPSPGEEEPVAHNQNIHKRTTMTKITQNLRLPFSGTTEDIRKNRV